ncbi:YHYH domain-containing protein [Rhizobium sp.]|nr:YHYH domain-containing protein [Rhizobium sp.]
MNTLRLSLLIVMTCCFSVTAFAHGGGLDSKGCHHERKTGGYHCHGKK